MEKKRKILELRERLDKTLASPNLVDPESLKSLVRNQILQSPLFCTGGNVDLIVEERTKEVSNFLGMLRSASGNGTLKAHEAHQNEWKMKQDTDQLRVMYREGPQGTPFHTLLAEGFGNGPLDVCLCVSWESTLYRKWFPQYNLPTFKVVLSDCLRKVRIGEEISLIRVKVPWPLSEREALLHYFEMEYLKEGLVLVLIKTISDMEHIDVQSHGFTRDGIPEAGDTVRIDLVGGFVMQRVNDQRSYFRMIGNVDIKLDFVPPWLINFISRQLIGNGHKLFQKAVSSVATCDEEYKQALKGPMYVRLREHLDSNKKAEVASVAPAKSAVVRYNNCTIENRPPDADGTSCTEIVEEETEDNHHLKIDELASGHSSKQADLQERAVEDKRLISPEVEHALGILDSAIAILRGSGHPSDKTEHVPRAFQKALSCEATPPDGSTTCTVDLPTVSVRLNENNLPNGHCADSPSHDSREVRERSSSLPKEKVGDEEDGSGNQPHRKDSTITKSKPKVSKSATKVHGEENLKIDGFHQNGLHSGELKRARKKNKWFCCLNPSALAG